ncbi:hypothetical protein D5086_016475 [Populus alba]|uniref:Uncharacterized protein n=1 Tax=Populus alba TaxID=43335 RepID=A0ACC4BU27_POPAL
MVTSSSFRRLLETSRDDENGDIEGNLIIAASLASPQQVSFLIKNGSGIVSVGMKEEDLERLKLPLMSPETENEDSSAPTLTITVDAKSGTCTGVSASDRAKTVLALSSPETKPEDFRRPGHVFPLKYRNGGVLRRAGHTEAYVDLVMLAGLPPVSVLSAIIDPDAIPNLELPFISLSWVWLINRCRLSCIAAWGHDVAPQVDMFISLCAIAVASCSPA